MRLELIEDALKKGGRKSKKQVHKFPVHELEEIAAWLRKILNEPQTLMTTVTVTEPSLLLAPSLPGMRLQPIPGSPSSEEKRKRKALQ